MKFKRLGLILFLSTMLLGACGSKESSSATTEETSIYTTSLPEEDQIQKGGSYSGYFIELAMNRRFAENTEYEFRFESNCSAGKAFRVKSSREESVTVVGDTTKSSSFKLACHEAGDSVITIYNAQDVLVYRHVLMVRKAYTQETIGKAMYDVDYFKSWSYMGEWKITITDPNAPFAGVLRGGDDFEQNIETEFTLNYEGYYSSVDCYSFSVNTTKTNSETHLTYLNVTRCCDTMYLYYLTGGEEHLLAIFYPNDIYDSLGLD